MVGIIQEQHPARCRLFMQWQEMEWPVLVDSLDLLEVAVVPITALIDEAGVVRALGPKEEAFEAFLAAEPATPARPATAPAVPDLEALERAARDGDAAALARWAQALVLWGTDADLGRATVAWERAAAAEPENGWIRFHLGVTWRRRYDSPARRPGDFRRAVEAWGAALALDPNQYIWRRRIQQVGPRLEKPYPFYDWVERARREVAERGELPAELPVEPGGAEIAQPAKRFETAAATPPEPDPQGRIHRDTRGFVRAEATVVPATVAPGGAVRVHVVLRPDPAQDAYWNNEAEDLVLWVDVPPGWQASSTHHTVPAPPQEVSDETRTVELELASPKDFRGEAELAAYALYYVCEKVDGTCLYRRQDVPIRLRAGS